MEWQPFKYFFWCKIFCE